LPPGDRVDVVFMAVKTAVKRLGDGSPKCSHLSDNERFFQSWADWQLWPALAIFLLATIIIRWPWLSGRVTIPWDAKAHTLPQIQFLARSLAQGESPFWVPYVFSGQPQIADPQSMIFSPPFLALALIGATPSPWAVDATLIAVVFLGGLALLVWFADWGWHWGGGLIAALAFAYGASMAWRIQHINEVLSLAYLPMAMVFLDRALLRRSIFYGLALGLITAAIALGRDQVALLSIYFLAALAVWRVASAERPKTVALGGLAPLCVAAIAALATIAVPVVLTYLLALVSNRPSIDYLGAGRGSLHPALLLTLLMPDAFAASGRMEDYWGPPSFAWHGTDLFIAQNMGVLYIGALPLALLVLAALRGQLWEREIRFMAIAALVVLLYALGWHTPIFRFFYAVLPGVDLYRRPADATFMVGALAAILAGYGTHRLLQAPQAPIANRHLLLAAFLVSLGLLVAVALGLWIGRVGSLGAPVAMAVVMFGLAGVAVVWARSCVVPSPLLAAGILAGLTAFDLAINNGANSSTALPVEVYDVLDPATHNATIAILKSKVVVSDTRRDRVELAGLGFAWPNASLTHELENTLGYNPLRLALYSAATGAENHVALPEQRKFSPLFPSYRSPLANMLGLRFIATGVPIEAIDHNLQPGELPLVARTGDGYIYENPDAVDRVSFVSEARQADFTAMLQSGRWPAADLKSTVLLEHAPPRLGQPPRFTQPGVARIAAYHNTEVVVTADSPAGGWVVLHDIWHPWWFAEIDGLPADILRANVLFRAVAVPAGRHTVRFTFRPIAGALSELAKFRASANP
jgi:hypothetical protein